MTEWQPIETAPKDLDDILLCSRGTWYTVRVGYWDNWIKPNGGWHVTDQPPGNWKPTHWMPLPSPPPIPLYGPPEGNEQ